MFCSADQLQVPMQLPRLPMQCNAMQCRSTPSANAAAKTANATKTCNSTHIPASSPFDLSEDWQGGGEDKMAQIARAKQRYEQLVLSQISLTTTLHSNHSGQTYKPHKTALLLQLNNSL